MDRNAYRNQIFKRRLATFEVTVKETNLQIHASRMLKEQAIDHVLTFRGYIESYIRQNPLFAKAMAPWTLSGPCPGIIADMVDAGQQAGVGPMAAVAGAMARCVGEALLKEVREVIVENGGDVFIKVDNTLTVGIFAGRSPLSLKIGLKLDPSAGPVAVCTSSGTIGHSISMGRADAVAVVSNSCALADAAATAIGNRVKTAGDIRKAVDFGREINGVAGIIVIVGDKIGAWGDVEVVGL